MTQESIAVGILANPSSGRDIRRLLARASVYPTSEKINDVLRLLTALGSQGVTDAWMMPDVGGITHAVMRTVNHERKRGAALPQVHMVKFEAEDSVWDTWRAVELMVKAGVRAIAVLGGDGTHRAVTRYCSDIPMATLSTGTNNAFPAMREATTTGLAMGLYVSGRVPAEVALRRNKILRVQHGTRNEIALVDVCVTSQPFVGARAVWQPNELRQLFVTFGEPDAIGLSSIAGLALPTTRLDPHGVQLRFGGERRLLAPIAPGLMEYISISSAERLEPNQPIDIDAGTGTVALDGEREIEFTPDSRVTVELDLNGPFTITVEPTLMYAAQQGVLWE